MQYVNGIKKFSDKKSMNQILGKKFMEWILVKINTLLGDGIKRDPDMV